MRAMSRLLILVAALSTAAAILAVPAAGSSDSGSSVTAQAPCVSSLTSPTGARAFLTPGAPLDEDPAFNYDDPDARGNPLELIRFPDEAGLWDAAGVMSAESLATGVDLSVPAVRAFAFTGPERWDAEISDSIVRLYCGLFDRRPDAFELEYWVGRYRNGLPLVTIAEAFTHSQEYVARYGVASDSSVVHLLFRDVLGREPNVETTSMLTSALQSGDEHRGQVVVRFTESAEYVRRTGTVSPVKPILPYPDVGSGRRIIYTNGGQRVWLINGTGELYKTHQVTGRRGIPSVGRYRIYSMSRYAWAPYDGITMEYMVRFARGEWPYGFHSIPIWPDKRPLQVPAKLGTHGSGGCVRQLWDDAEAVFGWSTLGTRVIVTP
ncbi:MAG: DUF4214 domain-containing protein [Acidimicrobiia bacterium]